MSAPKNSLPAGSSLFGDGKQPVSPAAKISYRPSGMDYKSTYEITYRGAELAALKAQVSALHREIAATRAATSKALASKDAKIELLEAELALHRGAKPPAALALAGRGVVLDDPFVTDNRPPQLAFKAPPRRPAPAAAQQQPLSPSAPPYSPTTAIGARRSYRWDPPVMDLSPRRPHHHRTRTPEQRFLGGGAPVFTAGMEPQNDRCLLHDFFESIRAWASTYTKPLSPSDITKTCAQMPSLQDLFAKKNTDISTLLSSAELRADVVAALVTRHIVMYTMSEHFLIHSQHSSSAVYEQLLLDFALSTDAAQKHALCQQQSSLYANLKADKGLRAWRDRKAEKLSRDLIADLACLLAPGANQHVLSELFIKGYRIGFRLRMEAVKWTIMWPTAGTDLNLRHMVNQSRNLCGDVMQTLTVLQREPEKFCVRFALTPTFTKSGFSSGCEQKEVIHSALVHVGMK